MQATGGQWGMASAPRRQSDIEEAEDMVKKLKNLFNADFKGDAVERMLLAAGIMDDWLWNPLKDEALRQVQGEDLKDSWQERQKGQAEALGQLEQQRGSVHRREPRSTRRRRPRSRWRSGK